jgi:hypothetical protein
VKWLLAGLLAAGVALAQPRPIASYDIRASLDTSARTITGTQTLTWVNDSPDAVPTLQFHLYLNAFKNENSTFFRGSGGQLRGITAERDGWGHIDISRIQIAGGPVLTSRIRFIQPDDRNRDDQTVIEAALPAPVPPGGLLRLEMDFVSKLPKVYARTGFFGDFYLAGHWFPKLGVWETRGFRQRPEAGWNCHQFHANSEFYANFGNYRVELTVPRQYAVGATGEQMSRTVNEKANKPPTCSSRKWSPISPSPPSPPSSASNGTSTPNATSRARTAPKRPACSEWLNPNSRCPAPG